MVSESTIADAGRPLKLVIAGGGSGGHVSPAVAVVEELRRHVALSAVWIGARDEFEGAAARSLGIEFRAVRTGKLRRYLSLETAVDAFRVPIGTLQAWRILKRFRPDVIVSTGGFVSVPSVVAGSLLDIPSITHEQTAHIGLATRINARFCDVIALSYERSRDALGATSRKIVVTGNPVRRFVSEGVAHRAIERFRLPGELPLIYVTGGAQGARVINAAILALLPELLTRAEVIHQCGSRSAHDDFDRLTARADELPLELRNRFRVYERVGPELGDIYAAASLVIGRAGAGTVAELSTVRLPSILVPLPGAEEQRQNALHLVDEGSAIMIEQSDLTPEVLLTCVDKVLGDERALPAMRRAASGATLGDAAERLVREILVLAGRCGADGQAIA